MEGPAALLDLLLPSGCAGCASPDAPWCPPCRARIGPITVPVLSGGPPVLAVGRYRGPLRTALLRYKERGRRDLGRALVEVLGARLDAMPRAPGELWLVPAPSRSAAARVRGGDHVARLCRGLAAERPGVEVATPLRLVRGARDSVGLDAPQRAANLAGRIRVDAAALPESGGAVLLVDDVLTTGATLRACRAALNEVGVPVLAALVLCDATARIRRTG